VVCCYNPCYNNKPYSHTYYQQNWQYFIMHEKDITCARTRFWASGPIYWMEKQWQPSGGMHGRQWKRVQEKYWWGIDWCRWSGYERSIRRSYYGIPLEATYFRGSAPIDTVWATPDVQVV
jgi:hypothetical protein